MCDEDWLRAVDEGWPIREDNAVKVWLLVDWDCVLSVHSTWSSANKARNEYLLCIDPEFFEQIYISEYEVKE